MEVVRKLLDKCLKNNDVSLVNHIMSFIGAEDEPDICHCCGCVDRIVLRSICITCIQKTVFKNI